MKNKDMKKANEWKDAVRPEILDSGTITGMVAYQLNLVLCDPKSSDKEKAMMIHFVRALGYTFNKNDRGTFDVTRIIVKNMNWDIV